MMLPSIFGENLFDEWMNDSGLMNPNFFGKGHSPLYGKHASNIMKTDIRENKDSCRASRRRGSRYSWRMGI